MEKLLENLNLKREKVKQLEAQKTKIKKGKATNIDASLPKTLDQCET